MSEETTIRAVVGKALGIGPEHVRLERHGTLRSRRYVVHVHELTSPAHMAAIALALDRAVASDVVFSIEQDAPRRAQP